jgi:hypothetical protein
MGVLVNELNNSLHYNRWSYNLDLHFLRSFRGVRMSRTEKILDQLLEDINLALLKAKVQLEYLEDENE